MNKATWISIIILAIIFALSTHAYASTELTFEAKKGFHLGVFAGYGPGLDSNRLEDDSVFSGGLELGYDVTKHIDIFFRFHAGLIAGTDPNLVIQLLPSFIPTLSYDLGVKVGYPFKRITPYALATVGLYQSYDTDQAVLPFLNPETNFKTSAGLGILFHLSRRNALGLEAIHNLYFNDRSNFNNLTAHLVYRFTF